MNVTAGPTERQLVERAISGDARAFRALFDRHAPAVRRFLRDLCPGIAAADEATQETFVRAHARLGALRDGDRLIGFLLGIARRVALEEGRRLRRVAPPELAETMADGRPDPERALAGRQADAALAAALLTLSEERRAALLLRVDHELPYEEIASVLDWSLPKVKNEIHRARLELRARLGEHLGTGAAHAPREGRR